MPKRRPIKEVWSLNPRFLGNKLKPTCVKNCIIQEPRSGGLAQKSLQRPKSKLSLCFDSNSSILAMPPELRKKIKKEESPSPGCVEDVKKGRGRPRKNLENAGGGNNSCDDVGNKKFKKLAKSKKSTVTSPSPKKVNKVKTSKSTNKTSNNRKKTNNKSISNISHDDELEMEEIAIREEEFEKRFQNDLNFVLAKFVVRRKVGFNIDKNKNLTGFRKRMQRVIEQADIMKLKSALDAVSGGDGNQRQQVSVPKHFSLPGSGPAAGVKEPQIAGKVKEETVTPRSSSPIRLSNENSPDISISGDNEAKMEDEEDEDNMPVLMTSTPEAQAPAIKDEPAEAKIPTFQTHSLRTKKSSAARKNLLASKFFSSQKKSQPMPLPMFKTLTKSMKIPKQSKSKVPKWIKNGDLWKWALNVDENGEYSW